MNDESVELRRVIVRVGTDSPLDESAERGKFPGTDISLRISTDAGKTFKQACFPVALRQRGYTLFDFHGAKGGPDFVSVDHDEEDASEAAAPMGKGAAA